MYISLAVMYRNLCFSWYFGISISSLSAARIHWYGSWSPGLSPVSGLFDLLFSLFFVFWFLVISSGISFDIVSYRILSWPSHIQCLLSRSFLGAVCLFLIGAYQNIPLLFVLCAQFLTRLQLYEARGHVYFIQTENSGPAPTLRMFYELTVSQMIAEWMNFKALTFTCQNSFNFFLFIFPVSSFCSNEFSFSPEVGYAFRISICFYGLFSIFF